MLLIQMTGLSGAGKTTIAEYARHELQRLGFEVEVIDGDVFRKTLCRDLGFSRADRIENIRRLGRAALERVEKNSITIISAINPYEEGRLQIATGKIVWVDCPLDILQSRDTKGLYARAALPEGHPDKIYNLTGVNDPFDIPVHYDLRIDTGVEDAAVSGRKLSSFILDHVRTLAPEGH
jgi:adenylylsulfate kinase